MLSIVMRAEAYAALGRPADSAKEWWRIAQHPGIVQLSATAPYSKLQLARTLALEVNAGNQNAAAQARAAYQQFFALWRDADSDIPILHQAHSESANLTNLE
jgi:hypothetical protein